MIMVIFSTMIKNKYLILRRMTQLSIIALFVFGNRWHVNLLQGNLSSAEVVGSINLSDPYSLLQVLSTLAIPAAEVFIGAGIIFVFYTLIRARLFCSWVCPMNIVTDAASLLSRKMKVKHLVGTVNMNKNTRYFVLALGLVLSLITGYAAFEVINPISMLHRALIFGSVSGLTVVLMVFLFDLFVVKHGWCGYFCPVGALYSALGRVGFLKVNHKVETCTKCMKCKVVCPEPQVLKNIGISSGSINMGACTDCGRCIEVCNDDSLNFKITLK